MNVVNPMTKPPLWNTHYECNENGNNFSRNLPLTHPQRTVIEQGAFESTKCEELEPELSPYSTPEDTN